MNRRLIYAIALALFYQGSGGVPITVSPLSAEGLTDPDMVSIPEMLVKDVLQNPPIAVDTIKVASPHYPSGVRNVRIPALNKIRRYAGDVDSESGDKPYDGCLFIDPPKLLGNCPPDPNDANSVNVDGDTAIVYIGPDLLLGQI